MTEAISTAGLSTILPETRPKMAPTLIVAPEDCYKHRTCPEPITRAGPEVPPENVNRLKVLTHPGVVAAEHAKTVALR